jgi:hypothetical protein
MDQKGGAIVAALALGAGLVPVLASGAGAAAAVSGWKLPSLEQFA